MKHEEPDQTLSYPTEEQVKELWDAYKQKGAEGIKEVLERREQDQASAPPPTK